jgi:hypothetical protein
MELLGSEHRLVERRQAGDIDREDDEGTHATTVATHLNATFRRSAGQGQECISRTMPSQPARQQRHAAVALTGSRRRLQPPGSRSRRYGIPQKWPLDGLGWAQSDVHQSSPGKGSRSVATAESCHARFKHESENEQDALPTLTCDHLWGRQGSNLRPRDYESPALTTELLPLGWVPCGKSRLHPALSLSHTPRTKWRWPDHFELRAYNADPGG